MEQLLFEREALFEDAMAFKGHILSFQRMRADPGQMDPQSA